MNLIKKHKEEIRQLSTKYKVSKLYAFGSVLTERFNTKSDIDFLVHFSGVPLLDHFDNYMNFKEHLKLLLSRNVDLIEVQTVKNPILKHSINQTKTLIYDRKRDTQMAL